jgi:hypothetical protein
MRMMLQIAIPTETGNQAIKDGSLHKIFEATMSKLKPEAAYFVAEHGLRSAMMFFDMKDASEIPGIAEPLFAGLNARIQLLPVMNADDLKKGLERVRQAM